MLEQHPDVLARRQVADDERERACRRGPGTGPGSVSTRLRLRPFGATTVFVVPGRVRGRAAGRGWPGSRPSGRSPRRASVQYWRGRNSRFGERRLVRAGDRHDVVDGQDRRDRRPGDEVLRAVDDLRAGLHEPRTARVALPERDRRAGRASGTASIACEAVARQPCERDRRPTRAPRRRGARRRAGRAPRRARSCSARSRPDGRSCRPGRRREGAGSRQRHGSCMCRSTLGRSDAHPDGLQPLASGGRRWRRAVRVGARGPAARRGPRGAGAHPRGRGTGRRRHGEAVAVPDPGDPDPARPPAPALPRGRRLQPARRGARSTRCSTTLRPDVVHTHAVQGLSSVALDPARRSTGSRTCTRSTTTGCCASATRWCTVTAGPARPRCRSCTRHLVDPQRGDPPIAARRRARGLAGDRVGARAARRGSRARLRVLYNPVEVVAGDRAHATGRRPAADVRLSSAGSAWTRASARCSTRSPAPALPDARLVVAGRGPLEPEVRAAGPSVDRGRLGRPGPQGGAARRPRLPRGAVAVEGPGAGRGERGPGAGHPGHRRRDRRHPRADRARVPAAPVPARPTPARSPIG